MHKLKLDPEMLRVESFAPRGGGDGRRGTVGAFASGSVQAGCSSQTRGGTDCQPTGYGWETCIGYSCLEKCALSNCPLDCGL
jgi:hypothetical protein